MARSTKAQGGKKAINSAFEPVTLHVGRMTCADCATTVERTLNAIPGVSATVDYDLKTANAIAPAEMDPKKLVKAIKLAGYSATYVRISSQLALHSKKSATALFFAILFTAPVLAISIMSSWHPKIDSWINGQLDIFNILHPKYSPTAWLIIGLSAPVVLIVAFPIHRAGIRNLFHPTMDTLITFGSLTAFGWSIYANITGSGKVYAAVSATIILIVIAGRFLESLAKRRASRAISTIMVRENREVSVVREGELVVIPILHLAIGDHFVANPGEKIATDGVVISGESSVDMALLTGESKPIDVTPGSRVFGSSLNNNGRLIIRATRVGSDSERNRIAAMVLRAQGTKAPMQRIADRVSAVFVPAVALLAIGTFLVWHYRGHHTLTQSISSAIAVLVIACPAAWGLASPVALLVASGRGGQRGIIIRDPRVLGFTRRIDSIILDKTGTVTNGTMSLIQMFVVPAAGSILGPNYRDFLRDEVILSTALSIELQSDHPIATAIATSISAKGIKPTTVTEYSRTLGSGSAGRVNLGMQSPVVLVGSPAAVAHATTPFHQDLAHEIFMSQEKGLTVSVLAWDGVALAMFAVGDEIKVDSKRTIEQLRDRGIEPWLVTGDSSQVAISVAREVGIEIDHVFSGALPQDKVEIVKKLQAKGHRVLMVGDGLNDAAALASADLSIAMGTAIATADIILMRRDLGSVIEALKLSSKTLRIIRENLAWAFLYNVIGIPIAMMGALQPMYAAGAMAISSLFVVANSLRIR